MCSGLADKFANGCDETHDRYRFGYVGLAAAPPNPLLITLHGKCGHGDNGDIAQLVIVLEPPRDFETGDFWQLNIHQNK